MNDTRTTRLRLLWAESKVTHEGGIELEVAGVTAGDKSHRVIFLLGPSSVGYVAEELHRAVKAQQDVLDAVKRQLRGES